MDLNPYRSNSYPYSTVFPYFYSDPTKPGYVTPNQNNPNMRFGVFFPNAFIPSALQSTYKCDAYVPPWCTATHDRAMYDIAKMMQGMNK